MTGIIQDTVSGALFLSVFDFLMSFVVLWFFGLVIKGLKKFS